MAVHRQKLVLRSKQENIDVDAIVTRNWLVDND